MLNTHLRIAVVGSGEMGSRHVRVVTQSLDATVACVVDPDLARARGVADQYGVEAKPELDDFDGIDAVIIAAATHAHTSWGMRAIEAGIPTLIEKPIADDYADTVRLVEAARRYDVPLMCGLLERFNPAVRTAMAIIGEPMYVSTTRHGPYAPRIKTGVAHDLLIHDVDIVLRVTGVYPTQITASFSHCHPDSDPDAEDIAESVLTFPGGLIASLSVNRVSQRKIRSIMFSDLQRLVEVDAVRQDVTVYKHVGNAPLDDGLGYRQQTIIDIPMIRDQREPLVAQLDRFLALTRGDVDPVDEREGLLAPHRLVAQIQESASTHPSLAVIGDD